MIDYAKLAIAGTLLLISFSFGWYIRNLDYKAYKQSVEIVAKTQEAKVESIQKQHELVTKGVKDEYDAKLALLRQYYANGVRSPSTSSMPNISNATKLFDASTAYNELAGNCAQTTLMLTELQKWYLEVAGIK